MNQDKLSILKMIESDDFNLLTSKELESTYELLTAKWEHDEHTNPSIEEYIATFPELPNKRSRDSAIANYGRINAKLRVIGFERKDRLGKIHFKCECICGRKTSFKGSNMPYSCGCLSTSLNKIKSRKRSVEKLESKIGEKHNRLKILAVSTERKSDKGMVIVTCDCGESEEFSVVYQSLLPRGKNGKVNTRSCGCYEREQATARFREKALKHVNETKNQLHINGLDGYDPKTKKQLAYATCLACNTEVIIRLNDWLTERNKTCGCKEGNWTRKSYKGRKCFFLEVLDDAEDRSVRSGRSVRFARCKCHACGREDYEVRLDNIINEQQISCGCIQSSGKDNLIDLLTDTRYSSRESTTYLVETYYQGNNHFKIGIAFNFQNRKSVAKREGAPYSKTLRRELLPRCKSWLLEQIVLNRLQKNRRFDLSGIIAGGTEMFDNTVEEAQLLSIFDEEFRLIQSNSFEERLMMLDCKIPKHWISGLSFKSK